jgi:hypothetical protein
MRQEKRTFVDAHFSLALRLRLGIKETVLTAIRHPEVAPSALGKMGKKIFALSRRPCRGISLRMIIGATLA